MTATRQPPFAPPGPFGVAASPPARPPSQLAAYLVCAAAAAVGAIAFAPAWPAAAVAALGAGVLVGVTTPLGLRFRSMPGLVAGTLVGGIWFAVSIVLAGSGTGIPLLAIGVLAVSFTVGLDWRQIDRLRLIPFVTGFLVLAAVSSGRAAAVVAAVAWLLLSILTLSLLESDRRAAAVRVAPLVPAAPRASVVATDVASTAIAAVAIAAIAALLLSAPSCSPFHSNQFGGTSRTGAGGSAGSGAGRGSQPGSTGSGAVYHRGSDGHFLLPDPSGGGSVDIPVPDDLARHPGRADRVLRRADGVTTTYHYDAQGRLHVTVTHPDGSSRSFSYDPQPDGTTLVHALDDRGRTTETYTYDPDGRLTDGPTSGGSKHHGPDLQLILLVVLVAAALIGLAWWWRRRPTRPAEPVAPPWALALMQKLEHEGERRGRPRHRDETPVAYTEALAADVLPDDRVAGVGRILSSALFGPREITAERRVWAEATFDAVLEAHPRTGRTRHRRAPARV